MVGRPSFVGFDPCQQQGTGLREPGPFIGRPWDDPVGGGSTAGGWGFLTGEQVDLADWPQEYHAGSRLAVDSGAGGVQFDPMVRPSASVAAASRLSGDPESDHPETDEQIALRVHHIGSPSFHLELEELEDPLPLTPTRRSPCAGHPLGVFIMQTVCKTGPRWNPVSPHDRGGDDESDERSTPPDRAPCARATGHWRSDGVEPESFWHRRVRCARVVHGEWTRKNRAGESWVEATGIWIG